jgi:hypothetical protein
MAQQTGRWHNTRRWQRRAKLRISPVRHVSREEGRHPGHPGGPRHATQERSSVVLLGRATIPVPCHNSRKKHQETHGYQRDIGAERLAYRSEPSGA